METAPQSLFDRGYLSGAAASESRAGIYLYIGCAGTPVRKEVRNRSEEQFGKRSEGVFGRG